MARQAPTVGSARLAAPGPRVALVGSIKELMRDIVDPSADVLFDAVFYDVTAAGVEEKMPKTNDEWKEVRRHALILAEAANLLRMPGRRVASEGAALGMKDEVPGPEDLAPAQIQVLIDRDRNTFNRLAQALSDAAQLALKAADARSVSDLFASGENIDLACESCHLKYWYPKSRVPRATDGTRGQR